MNWKQVSASPGYRSLKSAMINDIQEAERLKLRTGRYFRSPEEYRRTFRFAVGRAMHYAHHTDLSVIEILDQWEQ